MVNRGFGLEIEDKYGDTTVTPEEFDLDWWNQADDVDFKLNDTPVVNKGSSRMKKRVRAGVMKPTGSTKADTDLQQLAWYFLGFLDNYKYTEGETVNDEPPTVHTHEFWGGEGKQLTSFRGLAVYDMLKKYLYGLLLDQLELDVSTESMTTSGKWIYKTEESRVIGRNGETFEEPDALTNEELFVMFYDIALYLGKNQNNTPKLLDGVSTAFKITGGNNHDVDHTIGLNSRAPQRRASAVDRDIKAEITTTLTEDTLDSILAAEYGEVGALKPSSCKLLQLPLKMEIKHCEDPTIGCEILFPECSVKVDYNFSGADVIEAKLSLDILAGTVTLLDNTEITTDIYIKLINNQEELIATQ